MGAGVVPHWKCRNSRRRGGGTPPPQIADLKVGAPIPLAHRVEDKMWLCA